MCDMVSGEQFACVAQERDALNAELKETKRRYDAAVGELVAVQAKLAEWEVKPCPFCGSKAVLFVDHGVRVSCPRCGASSKVLVDAMTTSGVAGCAVKAVIAAWNKREDSE